MRFGRNLSVEQSAPLLDIGGSRVQLFHFSLGPESRILSLPQNPWWRQQAVPAWQFGQASFEPGQSLGSRRRRASPSITLTPGPPQTVKLFRRHQSFTVPECCSMGRATALVRYLRRSVASLSGGLTETTAIAQTQ